jgi:hypothetical protein
METETSTLSRVESRKPAFCTLHSSFCILHFALCILVSAIAAFALPTEGLAQDHQRPKIIGVRVGLGDRYKAGLWTPVEVTVLGGSDALVGELSVIVPDGDGVPGRATVPCQVLPGRETVVRLISRFGRVDGDLKAELAVDRRVVASRTFETAIDADGEHFLPAIEFQKLIVSVGPMPLGIEEAGKLSGLDADYRPVAVRIGDVEQLPLQWIGYEGVDAVILSTSRPELYAKLAANSARVQALDQWVRMGGKLILCVGAQGKEILDDAAALRQFAPGRLKTMVPLKQTSSLESYCGSRAPANEGAGGKVTMRVPQLSDVEGVVEASDGNLPLVIRTARGFGQVIFVAADLDQPPLRAWTGRPMLVAKLLDMPTTPVEQSKDDASMMHYGYRDLAGQLRSALDRFTGVRLVPFWLVAGLIIVYIVLIGPGDYFFLRKVVRRMEWTWLTFPVIVGLVCVGAYVLAYRLKGDQIRINQIDLVDVDAASARIRGTTWLNVFSPRMESFDFSVQPQKPEGGAASDAREWTAWLGLPGSAFGGMNARAGGTGLWTDQFQYAPTLDAMSGVPIQVWSTKSLTARWEGPCSVCPAANLSEAEPVIVGSIENTLPFPLENCLLVYRTSAYEIGTIPAGKSVPLGPTTKRSELKTLLTGQRHVRVDGDKWQNEATPYEQSSTDVAHIVRMMMFHEASGGRHYTRLWNDYQSFVDLSELLKAGRAILVAQTPTPASQGHQGAELLRDGRPLASPQDQHGTIYRFVFPVKRERPAGGAER